MLCTLLLCSVTGRDAPGCDACCISTGGPAGMGLKAAYHWKKPMCLCAGQKRAREMWFLARMYDAQQALQMGLVNTVVPLDQLESETLVWYVYLLTCWWLLCCIVLGE